MEVRKKRNHTHFIRLRIINYYCSGSFIAHIFTQLTSLKITVFVIFVLSRIILSCATYTCCYHCCVEDIIEAFIIVLASGSDYRSHNYLSDWDIARDLMVNAFVPLFGWSVLWVLTLVLPPGSREINTAYRINFLHGLISAIVAGLAIYKYIDNNLATTATISYFIIDFINIILNDFYFKVKSYQSPAARKVEYLHHILCCTVGIMSEFMYQDFCTFDQNPFVFLMLAEISTPFLISWRYTNSKYLGVLFILTFIGCRTIYHGFYFIPECIRSCHYSVGYGFGVPYVLMNLYFLYMIIKKLSKSTKKDSKKQN